MMLYPGNWPRNVSRDAKYSVISGEGEEMKIRLLYELKASERVLLTTSSHQDLVEKVNAIKEEHGLGPKGPFYINEYGHIIVPAGFPTNYYFAGRYEERLEFDFDGTNISAVPDPAVQPGDPWEGPHVGIPYVLAAGGNDIYYKIQTDNRERQERLSQYVGSRAAADLARRLSRPKQGSGRIYINEARHFFLPLYRDNEVRYFYAGALDDDEWFPEPEVPEVE